MFTWRTEDVIAVRGDEFPLSGLGPRLTMLILPALSKVAKSVAEAAIRHYGSNCIVPVVQQVVQVYI